VEDMKIKLFNHNDLDAVGCTILAYLAFGKENVSVEYCGYETINDKVKQFVITEDYKNYDYVYITDISINEEVAELIDNTHPSNFKDGFNLPEMFQLLDHHPTAMNLNKYWWCNVQIEDLEEKVSGTSLFYNELIQNDHINAEEDIDMFVEKVKRYDTWLWKTKYNDVGAKQLNDLLYIYGRERFIDRVINKILNRKFNFDNTDLLLLELEQDKITNYIEKKNKEITKHTLSLNDKLYAVGIVFAENYISELGNKLSEMNSDIDFVMIISNCKTVSYRTIKKDIDLGKEIAIHYGGGGHPQSSESQINEELKNKIIDLILS
jgi:oligoribonuclease NrnB/cAMP/cGMP phosphodiesterase (DHH superfamily)